MEIQRAIQGLKLRINNIDIDEKLRFKNQYYASLCSHEPCMSHA